MTTRDVHLYPIQPDGKTKSVMNLEVTVDSCAPQPLRVLRPFESMVLRIPQGLPSQATIVLQLLFSCFEKAQVVSEGLIGDMLWGFAQLAQPIPPELTLTGLRQLERRGFLKFQAKDNEYISLDSDQASSAWIRYQPKLLELVYDGAAK